MLRLVAAQAETLWDEALPIDVRELPADLAALDECGYADRNPKPSQTTRLADRSRTRAIRRRLGARRSIIVPVEVLGTFRLRKEPRESPCGDGSGVFAPAAISSSPRFRTASQRQLSIHASKIPNASLSSSSGNAAITPLKRRSGAPCAWYRRTSRSLRSPYRYRRSRAMTTA